MHPIVEPFRLTADRIPALRTHLRDPEVVRAAVEAANQLRLLFQSITTDDLLRNAMQDADPRAWLEEAAATAEGARLSLKSVRDEARELLRLDAQQRFALDPEAMVMIVAAETELRDLRSRLPEALDESTLIQRLKRTGLSDQEAQEVARFRIANGGMDPDARAKLDANIEAAGQRVMTINAYLADPLRDVTKLGDELLTEMRARHAATKAKARAHTKPESPAERQQREHAWFKSSATA